VREEAQRVYRAQVVIRLDYEVDALGPEEAKARAESMAYALMEEDVPVYIGDCGWQVETEVEYTGEAL
jgi:hypothetical protein